MQYVSYSLEGRIAPRAAASLQLAGRPFKLSHLATSGAELPALLHALLQLCHRACFRSVLSGRLA